jgi:hypothetical protein
MPGLCRVERESMASVVAHVAEIEARRLHSEQGYGSMFSYLVQGQGYSEEAAQRRLKVARLVRRCPAVLECLVDGRLHLTGASLLVRTMTVENCEALIAAASWKTKRAIETLLADLAPKPDVPTKVRRLPTPKAEVVAAPSLFEAQKINPSQDGLAPRPRSTTSPLGRDRFKVSFTASDALVGKMEQLGALLSHQVNPNDLPAILEKAVDVAIASFEKKRFGAKKSRKARASKAGTRHIPAKVRREVFERDGGRCTFESADGHRCDSTCHLQFDHIVPFGKSRNNEATNLRLRCRSHNLLTATKDYGWAKMAPHFTLTG